MKIEIFTVINALESFGLLCNFDTKTYLVTISSKNDIHTHIGVYVSKSDTLEFWTAYKNLFSFLSDDIIKQDSIVSFVENFSGHAFDLISDPIQIEFIKKNKNAN